MSKHSFTPEGVCSKRMSFELDGDVVKNICFEGGCNGNLQGLARLAEGRNAFEVAEILSGLHCGRKNTSCPDQFAKALAQAATPED